MPRTSPWGATRRDVASASVRGIATVACIHHLQRPFLGNVGQPLLDAGLTLTQFDTRAGDALPDLDEVDGIISLGGEQSVRELDQYPYLAAEVALLRDALARELPVLGVCLGAQLLAHMLGAEIVSAPERSVEWRELTPLNAAIADPLFGSLPVPIPALHWNEDVFLLPAGAVELLAGEGDGVEAFRFGTSAWGVQFHPDADIASLEGWYRDFGHWLEEIGADEPSARRADTHYAAAQAEMSSALFGSFARVVLARTRG